MCFVDLEKSYRWGGGWAGFLQGALWEVLYRYWTVVKNNLCLKAKLSI